MCFKQFGKTHSLLGQLFNSLRPAQGHDQQGLLKISGKKETPLPQAWGSYWALASFSSANSSASRLSSSSSTGRRGEELLQSMTNSYFQQQQKQTRSCSPCVRFRFLNALDSLGTVCYNSPMSRFKINHDWKTLKTKWNLFQQSTLWQHWERRSS